MSGGRRIGYDLAVATESHLERELRQPLGRDVYCPACDCNRRGVAGNPVRCPACGQYAAVEQDDEIARRHFERRLKWANGLATCWLVGLLGAALCVVREKTGGPPAPMGKMISALIGSGAAAWGFRRVCRGGPGWFGALIWSGTLTVAGLIVVGGSVVGVVVLTVKWVEWTPSSTLGWIAAAVLLTLALVGSIALVSHVFVRLAQRPLRRILLRGRPVEPP